MSTVWKRLAIASILLLALAASGCGRTAPTSDDTPPRVYLLAWDNNGSGGQGSQRQYLSGSTLTVARGFLGQNQADIRIYGEDNEGVNRLDVSGSAKGICSSNPDSSGQSYTSPSALSAALPAQSQDAGPGRVEDFLAVHLDAAVLTNASCGNHKYGNMAQPAEFFLDSGTWAITGVARNCCGLTATSTFTIIVR